MPPRTVSGPSASTASTRNPRRVARARTAALAREVTSSFTTDRPPRISLAWARHRAQTGGDELAGLEPPRTVERHPQDCAGREGAAEREHVVAREVAERVGDQPALVP